jgi:hypothetical protein
MGFYENARGNLRTSIHAGLEEWQSFPEWKREEIKAGLNSKLRAKWDSLSEAEKAMHAMRLRRLE